LCPPHEGHKLRPPPFRRGAFCWLPGLLSQSVVLWDVVGLEMVLGPKRHLSLSLSLEPLR